MIYQLKIDEILEALINSNDARAREFQGEAEALANSMATRLANSQGIIAGVGDFQGLCPFSRCV